MKNRLKQYFIAGALVITPLFITVWVVQTIILWADSLALGFFPRGVRQIFSIYGFEIPGLGLIFTGLIVLLTGLLTRLYLGRKILDWGDTLVQKIPFGRSVYSAVKQLMESVLSSGGQNFRRVVLVKSLNTTGYMLGFVTGDSFKKLSVAIGEEETLTVFIPTAPNPTSGFLVVIPKREAIAVNVSPDTVFKFVLSGGTVTDND